MHLCRKWTTRYLWPLFAIAIAPAQQPDGAAIIRDLDAANQARFENVLSFTDVEHYAVFRDANQTDPAAEMTVRTTYVKGVGKSYVVLAQSGSAFIERVGLQPLLENEKAVNDPAKVSQSWFTSANYEMKLEPGAPQVVDGRKCLALSIAPRHKAPNMIEGMLWVEANNHMLVQVEGKPSKSPSVLAGTTHMMRRYVGMQGYAMATHAWAESHSVLFGRTVIVIDYSDYRFQLRPAQ